MSYMMGKIMENALELNQKSGVDVYVCLQGNTNCFNLTVEEKKSVSYQNRVFTHDQEGLLQMQKDLETMLEAFK